MDFDRPAWQDMAMCSAQHRPERYEPHEWVNLWFSGRQLKPLPQMRCNACPARILCLEKGVRQGLQATGHFGGVGSRLRRSLIQLRRKVDHDYTSGCGCDYCSGVRKAIGTEDRTGWDHNGPDVTHGTRATYSRGCHCNWCSMAQAEYSLQRGMATA